MEPRRHARRGERGTHPALIAIVVVLVLVIAVVVFLLVQKPKQVTPVAVLGTSPSASAAAATPTPVPVTLPPTAAPTPTPIGTAPAFANLSAPQRVACNGQSTIHPHMTWSVVNATGITISIDEPGGVFDSYGTSGATDQQSDPVPFSCSGQFKHTYYFTTTGGTGGPDVTRKVTITGTP